MIAVDIVIIVCMALLGYCFVVYPIVIRLLAARFPEPMILDESYQPTVSIILAVHNEERVLERCLQSLLRLDYPKDNIELLIGSDGSIDRTNEIVRQFSAQYPFIRPFFFTQQRGKMPVLNDLVTEATGAILFFVDADILLSSNSIRVQVRHFIDPVIGAVAGAYEVHTAEMTTLYNSEKEYASIEHQVRLNESSYYSTLGLFGGNYTLRRELWRLLPDGLVHDDLFVVFSTLHRGYRIIFEPEAISVDHYKRTYREEFRRKSRSASRGYHTLSFFPSLLFPRTRRTAFLLWSHKILRWLSPVFILTVVIAILVGLLISGPGLFSVLLTGVGILAALSIAGFIAETVGFSIPLVRQLSWFVVMNIAYLHGSMVFLTSSDTEIWKPSTRAELLT